MKVRRTKGYILVESITAISISLMITCIITTALIFLIRFNTHYKEENKGYYSAVELIRFIEVRLKEYKVESYEITNYKITIFKKDYIDTSVYDMCTIEKDSGSNILISYYTSNQGAYKRLTTKKLLKEVEEIAFSKKGELLYIYIRMIGGEGVLKEIVL